MPDLNKEQAHIWQRFMQKICYYIIRILNLQPYPDTVYFSDHPTIHMDDHTPGG